ncbi:hypothetical protein FS749_014808 [Ceratobasidium sp. UAMH 11750]|nr:hypothetical protein FS749_014808 [Ceratobasidium sp. UAMH 11750]
MARLSQLRTLRICVPDPWQPAAQIPRFEGAVLPVGSFPSLKRLEISTWLGFEKLFSQLWSTPIVTNLAELLIQNQSPTNPDIFPVIAMGSPCLQELRLGIIIYRFEIDMLAPLRSLPLCVLTISGSAPLDTNPLRAVGRLWPELEDLCLQRTRVGLVELPNVFSYLPKLKRLSLAPPSEFSPEVVSLVFSYHPPSIEHFYAWRSRSLNLVINYRWANRVEESRVDILARILVMTCPNVKLELEDYIPRTVLFRDRLQARVCYHREQILRMSI